MKPTNLNITSKARMTAVAAIIAAGMSTSAQINSTDTQGYLTRALEMYHNANYHGCLDQLTIAADAYMDPAQRETADWYGALAAFALGHADAEARFAAFLERYGASEHREDARMYMADCLFTVNYAEALARYLQVDPRSLSPQRRLDYDYRVAYCYLKLGEYDKALAIFDTLTGDKLYGHAAKFYRAYIAYTKGDYDRALTLFGEVDTSREPGSMADYYMAQIYYARGAYNDALAKARRVLTLNNAPAMFNAEASRIAGESLYLTGNAAQAIPYLQKYVKVAEKPELSALYILGLSQYEQGMYREAADTLTPVTHHESSMGQNALVYVGQSLLKLGEKDAAIMAFDNALGLDYDPKARENAYYNYAVAKYMGGSVPFGSSVKVFESFLKNYPDSPHADDVRQYVIAGYVTDKDYDSALSAINRVKNPGSRVLAAKQQVLYAIGSRQLAAGQVAEAVKSLEQADALSSHDARTALYNTLTLGEAYVRASEPSQAVKTLQRYLDSAPSGDTNRAVALYDLGYAHMALKQYEKAAEALRQLTSHPQSLSESAIADAYNRLGDCHYYNKDWNAATEAYRRGAAHNKAAGDYPLFQQAVIAGYTGDFKTKLSLLSEMMERYPESPLTADGMLESVESHLRLDNPDKATATLREIMRRYPSTAQGRQASLQLAMVQEQLGLNDSADKSYRNVITTYPSSDEAAQAVEILKRRAAAGGTMDELMAFVNKLEGAPRVDTSEADRVSFNAAEQAWLERDDISLMKKYIADYPDGDAAVRALAYLMDEADSRDDDQQAYDYACRITDRWPDNSAAEDAYAIRADIEYDRGNTVTSRDSWNALARRASTPENADMARLGLMRIARDMGQADNMLATAEGVLASSTIDEADRNEATFTRALALEANGNPAAATEAWESITGATEDPYGARASVYLAQHLLDTGSLDKARQVAQKFVGSATSQTYWLARGFIVLSDISRAQGNDYEADAFLKALKSNYPGTEADIFTMIQDRLEGNR